MSSSQVRYVAVSLCVAVGLAGAIVGCSAKDDSGKSASQVAVKVNKKEITVHQVNDLLSRAGNVPQDQVARVRDSAVERLVEQELLVQAALKSELDRNPGIQAQIEFLKRDLLARAYSESIAKNAVHPTDAQIAAFYEENQELFAKRRVYSLQEINIQVAPDRYEDVRARLSEGGNLQQLAAWFREQKIPFAENMETRAAEQLPPDMRKNLAQLNAGQLAVVRTPTGAALLFIIGVRDEPVDRARAKPIIENILTNQAGNESVRAEIKRLREAAAIEYVGDFAPSATASSAAPAQTPSEPASDADPLRSALEKEAAKLTR